MKRVCSTCDEPIESDSKHKLSPTDARHERRGCPYCKEQGDPMCRVDSGKFLYECGRCRARWTRQD
jgi:hypothetical protein